MAKKRTKTLCETLGHSQLGDLIDHARAGDQTVLPELRKAFENDSELWRQSADLAQRVEQSWFKLIAGTDTGLAEALRQKLLALKRDLGVEESSPLERLVIERIAVSWLAAMYSDLTYAEGSEASLAQAAFLLRRQATNHVRLLEAVKALARLRRDLGVAKARRKVSANDVLGQAASSELKKSGQVRKLLPGTEAEQSHLKPTACQLKKRRRSAAAAARSSAPAVAAPPPKPASEECRVGDP